MRCCCGRRATRCNPPPGRPARFITRTCRRPATAGHAAAPVASAAARSARSRSRRPAGPVAPCGLSRRRRAPPRRRTGGRRAAPAPSPAPARGPRLRQPRLPRCAIPGSVRLHYKVSCAGAAWRWPAQGELLWRHDGETYEARLEISAPLLRARTQHSTGRITAEGLAPLRFSDKARSEEAAHFERDQGKVSFSSNRPDAPLLPGAQDRLSVLLQLRRHDRRRPGEVPARHQHHDPDRRHARRRALGIHRRGRRAARAARRHGLRRSSSPATRARSST